jgi:hypothetical protein
MGKLVISIPLDELKVRKMDSSAGRNFLQRDSKMLPDIFEGFTR